MKVAFSENRERDSVNTESKGEPRSTPAAMPGSQAAARAHLAALDLCYASASRIFFGSCLLCRLCVGSPHLIPSLKSGTSCALALSDLGWENLVHCILETHSLVSAGV